MYYKDKDFVLFLKNQEIKTNYTEDNYGIVFEEYTLKFPNKRNIMGIRVEIDKNKIKIKIKKKLLIELTELIFYIMEETSAELFEKKNLNRSEIYKILEKLREEEEVNMVVDESNLEEIEIFRYTLIYKITPEYPDEYFREKEIKESETWAN